AEVIGYDPVAREIAQALLPEVSLAETPLAALSEADAAVLVTEWPVLIALDWSKAAEAMSGNLVVDGRNCLPVDDLVGCGLVVASIGRPRREGDP
ncbi:MAG: UDP binding domain-containing protein, partial [bacterium]